MLRQCYTKDTPPAHKLRSVLTGYARPKGLTTYDQELTTYAIGSGFTPTKAQESRPQAHNLRSGAHRPRSCHGFIVDVQEPTDHNALLNSWSASPPTRPLRHRWFGRQQPQQVFFDFTKHRLWHRHYRNLLQVSCITWNRFFPSIEPCLCFLPPGEEPSGRSGEALAGHGDQQDGQPMVLQGWDRFRLGAKNKDSTSIITQVKSLRTETAQSCHCTDSSKMMTKKCSK